MIPKSVAELIEILEEDYGNLKKIGIIQLSENEGFYICKFTFETLLIVNNNGWTEFFGNGTANDPENLIVGYLESQCKKWYIKENADE